MCVALGAIAASIACLTVAGIASAQTSPSITDLKAAAYDAEQAAAQAQRAATEAQAQAAQAQAAIQKANEAAASAPPPPPPVAPTPVVQAPPVAPAPVVQAAPAVAPAAVPQAAPAVVPAPVVQAAPVAAAAPAEAPVTREELDRALEKAENAAATARKALAEVEAYKEKQRMRYARNGLTLSAGAFWAPDLFDTSASIDPSLGLSGGLGYRVHPHFSVETSFVLAQGFDVATSVDDGISVIDYQGDVQMWSALIGGKFYLMTRKVQPYIGIGLGAAGAKIDLQNSVGAANYDYKDVGGVIAFNGGLDLYVSESLALGLDAAVYLPGGNLQGLDFSTLGAKLIYRF